MKYKVLAIGVLLLAVIFTGCTKKTGENKTVLPEDLPETGNVVDVSQKSGGSMNFVPGDIVYIRLVGEANSQKQWSVVSPTSSDILVLKDHKITGLTDETAKEFTDEWWLKVVKRGQTLLQFDYGIFGEAVEQSFTFNINVE